ncbi:hypothetical protein FA13DRAFT_1784811 [Coprinellus micaceus]|uniref:Nephrocystin 3-like N-terminal domain-containing protein n=1 Tax=Coprinellus micaceus TaxID=71717 RepID=A0A4Y7U1V2_COPMI|nr:hypothetical protein FA13DRAFT_1784811 [Coprinellus micaceus]
MAVPVEARRCLLQIDTLKTVSLEEYVSKGAAHNSHERGIDAPKCHPETRKAVQENILSHIGCGEERVLWLSGPAGAGKTAIMGSIAEECHARGWLAGSFFISASSMRSDRCSKRYLVPTLASHLLELNIPNLPAAILTSIAANPSVFDKRLDHQTEILILAPIREVCKTADLSKWPKVVLVDGVDECAADEAREYKTKHERQESKEANHREVLSSLVELTNDPSFPFRIVIASRPEHAIEGYFSSLPFGVVTQVFLDDKYSPEDDITLYAQAMLTKIGRDSGLLGQWYSQVGKALEIEDVPRHLAQQASGQFIYIATVIRYIQDKSGAPHKQLEHVLNWQPSNRSNPFAVLDTLYLGILQTSPNPARLGYKVFLESFPGEMEYLLSPLVSLVCIVGKNGEPDFHFYHKSLSDFLKDPQRCGAFHIPEHGIAEHINDRYIEVFKNKGPQGLTPHEEVLDRTLQDFCINLSHILDLPHKKQYDASHVDWWLSHLPPRQAEDAARRAFVNVHQNRQRGVFPTPFLQIPVLAL